MTKEHDQEIEQAIKDKELEAPRVTLDQIENLMEQVQFKFHVVEGTTTTVCTAVLPMGDDFFTLATEYSACASPENFNVEIGQQAAQRRALNAARDALWVLEGYALKKQLTA